MAPDTGDGHPEAAEPAGYPVPEPGLRAERPNFLTAAKFSDFDLPPEIMAGVDQAGFEFCTPIQALAIPVAMKGLDIAGQAQTGTGKTTAFLIPLMNRLLKNKPLEPDAPRAIIVTPTRELALQIHEDALVLGGATSLRQALVIGGIEYREQAELLGTAPEIVICTPGRIIDYLQQGIFKTKGVEVAVVDEADRLLDMGFIKDLKYLLGKLPPFSQRQTMLFSATLDARVLELTYQFMNPPQFITAEPDKATKLKIEQELYHVGREEKLSLLMGLLRREPHSRVIIFANTKSGVEWLAKKLTANGFQAEGITGDLPQPKRLRLMEAFKEDRLHILAATDVASRGIHVEDVSHIYNYDLPQDAENYVHRIGRTARAGREGKAVSFGCEDYVFHLEAIENLLGEKIPVFWADNEWFQTDVGGEVSVKERRGRGASGRGTPGREASGREASGREVSGREGRGGRSGRPAGRTAARSQRSGGIFGLSPRLAGDPAEDELRRLSWAAGEPEMAPEPEISTEDETALEEGGREGRRRRRRRGRRGRDASAGQPRAEQLQAEQPQAEQPQAEQPPIEQPQAEQSRTEQPPTEQPGQAPGKPRLPRKPKAAEDGDQPKAAPKKPAGSRRKPAESPAEGGEAPPAPGGKGRRKPAGQAPAAEAGDTRPEESEKPKRVRKPKAPAAEEAEGREKIKRPRKTKAAAEKAASEN